MATAIRLVILSGWVASCLAQVPTPARAPKSWELQFAFEDPQRITLVLPGDSEPSTYWYVVYRVENASGRDIQFFPAVELVSSSLEVLTAGDGVSPTVYDAIVERHRATHPFMVPPHRAMGQLLQGEDNARTSMAVFRQFNLHDNAFTVYFSGLSGEIQQVANPSFDKDQPSGDNNQRYFTMRKTLALHYRLPGDPQTRSMTLPVRTSRDWVMR